MKFIQKIFYIFIKLFFIFLLCYFIFNKQLYYQAFKETIILWFNLCLTPISIAYIIAMFLYDFPLISKILYPILKYLFRFENQKSCSIFLISIIVGSPTSTKLIVSAIDNQEISTNEGNRLLSFSSFISSIFLYSILDFQLFIIILIIELLVSFATANITSYETTSNDFIKTNKLSDTYFNIINNLPNLLLSILSSMIITNLLGVIINNQHIKALLELTYGVNYLINCDYNLINNIFLFILIFSNGVAIILQTYWIIKKSSLSFINFIKYRIISVLLSLTSLIIIYLFVFFL